MSVETTGRMALKLGMRIHLSGWRAVNIKHECIKQLLKFGSIMVDMWVVEYVVTVCGDSIVCVKIAVGCCLMFYTCSQSKLYSYTWQIYLIVHSTPLTM